ncbi:periplasmic energy transduction protein, TonB-related protein [Syntrophotalea carbinolica DSM 2380]|uniref:Periplasmic energy transduction protein, TonB-related protein n=1 Tax=Syntrophotalea carbinolica (strain DSM 2380 / NBRC 103641 / GraBd1) TaxID=338963 RepID=Q3A1X9_SYNC1|nr:energy transducer TonB [Syntrophotalea carbinolica]ABA89628.1 periplasmic energy transduction protein, TonB-related protein [Syntrophotalea carbinolica DSM 2380]
MKAGRTWLAFGASLAIHLAVVLALGMGLMQPHRLVNRVEVDLEGAAAPSVPAGVRAPSPVAGPEMPQSSSVPSAAAVPAQLAVASQSFNAPTPSSFDPDGELQVPVSGGLPGPTSVALTASGGGSGGMGAGSGPGTQGAGQGRRGSGSASALAGYLNAIRARVDAAKRYPQMAQQRRQEGVATVTFRLTPDGRLAGTPTVTRSSGYRQLDKAALRAVNRGAPYPAFPLDPRQMKALEIPVKFYLR